LKIGLYVQHGSLSGRKISGDGTGHRLRILTLTGKLYHKEKWKTMAGQGVSNHFSMGCLSSNHWMFSLLA